MPPVNKSLVSVTMKSTSGFPRDDVVNNFSFVHPVGFTEANFGALIFAPLQAFYNTAQSTGLAPASFMSTTISRVPGELVMRAYNIDGHEDGSPHGSPVATGFQNLTNAASGAGSNLPSEVAAVLTLESWLGAAPPVETPDGSDPGGAVDRPRQRRTGRIYLGPLQNDALEPDAAGQPRFTTEFITTILEAANDLAVAVAANTSNWAVWSRANADFAQVVRAKVDNAPDTQRRRGCASTVRTALTF